MDRSNPSSAIKDPKRIDVDDPAEFDAWCAHFRLAPDDLRAAVGIIGPMSAAIAVYVNTRGRRGASRQAGEIGHPFTRHEVAAANSRHAGDSPTSDE